MILLGERQILKVVRFATIGAYLGDEDEQVLLPKKYVPSTLCIDDEIDVFIYRDSKDRLVATTEKPKLTLGTIALLKVSQITDIGAFMDWGLEKDLLLPFREQTI